MKRYRIHPIFLGETAQKLLKDVSQGEYVTLFGETFYQIKNINSLKPFFMSIVSSSNHWLFISSTGGLSAGRVSAEQSLFPYYTEDKLTENSENTGSKAILLVTRTGRTSLWEPFSDRLLGVYNIERNLYKNITGTVLVFEEKNFDLGLSYRYSWRMSDAFGFVRTAWLQNIGDTACQVELVDGLQNILPANVAMSTQNTLSSLLDAYKFSEVDSDSGLAIFALNSTLTDLAEPSESLLATTVIQIGLDEVDYLLSSRQLDKFRLGLGVEPETEVRGQRCAYFVHASLNLDTGAERNWHLVAEVSQDSTSIVRLSNRLKGDRAGLVQALEDDIALNNAALEKIVAAADGLQESDHPLRCANHFANTMFNAMRGGIFADQYQVHTDDLVEFIKIRNHAVLSEQAAFFSNLPEEIEVSALQARAEAYGSEELIRLCCSYLPLSFSRRHGDPSRPWNRFAINIKKEDGSKKLDYEGNWRDIFQNWEALAYSYPEYVENMICAFLNATTADGYNPYRITRQGIDWELPEPGNPWSNIGYWSDHQIIYLQKLMEISSKMHPGRLQAFLTRPIFSYANVPYRIKPYADLLADPHNTIEFDWNAEREIETSVKERGTDGKLVYLKNGRLLQAPLAEKLLTLLLAKLVNFVPEGGIWMNTQRPEWNDANNALVGKGLSVVTLSYLRRFTVFFKDLLKKSQLSTVEINAEVQLFYQQVAQSLTRHQGQLAGPFSDEQRRSIMDELGLAGGDYRREVYSNGFSGQAALLPIRDLAAFLDLTLRYIEHSLRANQRRDALYHAYNILHLAPGRASITHLYEMLEGQVAILSSGLLTGEESLALLESLHNGPLYQPGTQSYILYPDRRLQGFLEKNRLAPAQVQDLALVSRLVNAQDKSLIVKDEDGNYHFSGSLRNSKDVERALHVLQSQPQYAGLVKAEAARIKGLFEATFHHNEFTGRSGTFFAYEGLGSVYWHMVSKLMLAVQETILRTSGEPFTPRLIERYTEIRKGQGFNKTPKAYGAFPTDPYSHTPQGQGAKQPGMTGMVKEEILVRQIELGLTVEDGCLVFEPLLFDPRELLTAAKAFNYLDVKGRQQKMDLEPGSLAYTICQTPVIITDTGGAGISVHFSDDTLERTAGFGLDAGSSRHIFKRDGVIHHITVTFPSGTGRPA